MSRLALADIDKALRLADKIELLFERKRKGRCSAKIHLEEYVALRFLVLVYEIEYGVFISDEQRFVEEATCLIKQHMGESGHGT